MLETLNPQPQDKILQLIAMFRDDPRTKKIDLGVGVYKDATGLTPVMRAVKAAEKKLWETEKTKTYTGLAGEPAFNAAMVEMILGAGYADRAASVATPGGTGAIRQALELIRMSAPGATVWLSNPTWPNHPSIIKYLGMPMAEYRYFDAATRGIDFAGLIEDLGRVKAGDAVLISDPFDTVALKGPGVFIAGGTGVTPFIAVLRQLQVEGKLAGNALFHFNKTKVDAFLVDEFTAMLGRDFHGVLSQEDAPGFLHGAVNADFLRTHIHDFRQPFYTCGPEGFVLAVKNALVELGADSELIDVQF